MKSSAVKPGYVTIAICVMRCSCGLGKGLAVLIRRDADSANEVAAHAFRGTKAAARRDGRHGVVGLLELPARGLGADTFDVGTRRLTDLRGEHSSEMPWAHVGSTGQLRDAVHAT